jgi:hypothetical protein
VEIMAWCRGTAATVDELMTILKGFVTKGTKAGGVTKERGNIQGDGVIENVTPGTGCPDEIWSIIAESATTFSVIGSESGTRSDATVGVDYDNGIIAFKITAGTSDFVVGDTFRIEVQSEAVVGDVETFGVFRGGGTIQQQSSTGFTPLESYTITCITAGEDAEFSVNGSVSGNVGIATVGEIFFSDTIGFIIVNSGDFFEVGDEFNLAIDAGSTGWNIERWDNSSPDNYELILNGEGYSGNEEIFIGFKEYLDSDYNYRGIHTKGFTGYDPAREFLYQPGSRHSGSDYTITRILVTTYDIQYFFTMNPQRISGFTISGSSYDNFYLGYIDAYATKEQWRYPLFEGGSSHGNYSYTETNTNVHSAFWLYDYGEISSQLKGILDGTEWFPNEDYVSFYVDPYSSWYLDKSYVNPDGTLQMFPCALYNHHGGASKAGAFGELEGWYAFCTDRREVTVEDYIIDSNGLYHIVTQEALNTGRLCAVKLEGE